MGIFDRAKDLAAENPEAINQGIDQAANFADEKTGGQYSDQIQQGADFVQDRAGDVLGGGQQGGSDAQQGGSDAQQGDYQGSNSGGGDYQDSNSGGGDYQNSNSDGGFGGSESEGRDGESNADGGYGNSDNEFGNQ